MALISGTEFNRQSPASYYVIATVDSCYKGNIKLIDGINFNPLVMTEYGHYVSGGIIARTLGSLYTLTVTGHWRDNYFIWKAIIPAKAKVWESSRTHIITDRIILEDRQLIDDLEAEEQWEAIRQDVRNMDWVENLELMDDCLLEVIIRHCQDLSPYATNRLLGCGQPFIDRLLEVASRINRLSQIRQCLDQDDL